ncbi:SDR family NAD(P)-dependent oxidoreductase [soil metagenome]
MNSVLITGGAGFIGSALARQLAPSHDVVVLDDLSSGKRANLDGVDVDLRVGSILDRHLVDEIVGDVQVIYHLACKGVRQSIHDPLPNHEVNASGTLNLLESARKSLVSRFVYTSTSEVYGTARHAPMSEVHPTWPHTVYGAAKLAGESYTRAYHLTYGLNTVVVRPFNAFGPRSHHEGDTGEVIPKFLVRAMNGLPPVIFGDGTQTRDFTYVEDTAAGIADAAQTDGLIGTTLNLGSGEEISIANLAYLVLRVANRTDLEPIYDDPRPGDVRRLVADATLARSVAGWRPRVELEAGIRRLLEWHEETGTDWEAASSEDRLHNWMN